MPESADDPMAELFRHGSTNAQTLITGAARIMDQRQLRTNHLLQDRARYEARAAERAQAETAVLTGVDTASPSAALAPTTVARRTERPTTALSLWRIMS